MKILPKERYFLDFKFDLDPSIEHGELKLNSVKQLISSEALSFATAIYFSSLCNFFCVRTAGICGINSLRC